MTGALARERGFVCERTRVHARDLHNQKMLVQKLLRSLIYAIITLYFYLHPTRRMFP